MGKAFVSMTTNGKCQQRYYSARGYEEAKKNHSVVMKEWIKENHPKGFKHHEHSDETKQKISASVKQSFKEKGLLKPVFRFSLCGEFEKEYDSITNAANDVGGVPSNIKYTCEGKFKTAYGYRWSYNKNKCDNRSLERKKHYHTEIRKKYLSTQWKGTVWAIDNKGNNIRVKKDDIRFSTGELVIHKPDTTKLKVKHKCPHCGKQMNIGNLQRWHGDNCKTIREN